MARLSLSTGWLGQTFAAALLAISMWPGPVPQALAEGDPFVLEGEVTLDDGVLAVAINADEALIAAALEDGGVAPVVLLDRRSRAPLGTIAAETGAPRGLAFAPDRDLLLIWGEEAIEVWRVDVAALSMDRPLPQAHRLWRQPVEDEPPVADAGFLVGAGVVVWGRGDGIYERGLALGATAPTSPARTLESPIRDLAPHPSHPLLAVALAGEKRIQVLQGGALVAGDPLEIHRFPVSAVGYLADAQLVSVDEGRNLVRWDEQGQSAQADYLKDLPAGAQVLAIQPLQTGQGLLLWAEGNAARLGAVAGDPAALGATLAVPAPPRVALSPTGRYVVLAEEETLRLWRFADPVPPAEYVRRLRNAGAGDTALTFVRMLDAEAVPAGLRRAAEQELAKAPVESVLADLVRRLRDALAEADPEAVEAAAGQVLNRVPDHAEALQALRGLRELRDRRVLAEAREAYDAGAYRRAIGLLSSGIADDSPQYAEAGALIAEAEARRDLESLLDQARQKMEMELYSAAETLVNEALRRDTENTAALALQDEIGSRSGAGWRNLLAMALGGLFALAIVGGLFYRLRRRGRQAPPVGPAARAPRSAEGPAERQTRRRERPNATVQAAKRAAREGGSLRNAVRFSQAAERLRQAEEMLRLCKQADRGQSHTAFLLEVEAELTTLNRRLGEQSSDPDKLLQRIEAIRGELRGLRFEKKPADAEPPPEDQALDYYALLQVPYGASEADIKTAYKRLIKEYHPDRHNRSEFGWIREEAERMSRQLSEAYRVLSDANSRARYDRELARKRGPAR